VSVSAPVLEAALAAMLFAVGNNLQRHAASSDEHKGAGPFRLLARLWRTPRWLAGGAAALVALVFQARALTEGGVILVQSVIASTLVYSLAIEGLLERRWPRPPQILGSIVVVSGIVLLVDIGKPGVGGEFRSIGRALAVLAIVGVVGGGALYRSQRRPKGRRTAIALGASAGVCFALDAVFLRGAAASLSPLDQPTFLINAAGFGIASLLGNLVIARGFQSAPLRHVLPAMAAAEPLTAFLCGRLVFGEHLAGGPLASLAVGSGLMLMVVGVVLCALGQARTTDGGAARKPAPPSTATAR
jgi:drug/metabolite transporter (DMT)-like permease